MTAPWWLPTDAWVRRALVPALAFIALAGDQGYLADFWHHLARGRAMTEQRALVDHDLFTFTVPGETFVDVNWLSQLFYFGLFQLGGLGLVRTVNALFMAVTLALLVELCRRRSRSLLVSCLVTTAVFLGLWQVLTIRPQTFSLFYFVLLLHVLDRAEENPRWLFAPPLILALWTNMHGAFPAGLLAIACHCLAQFIRTINEPSKSPRKFAVLTMRHAHAPLSLCLLASFLATLANPYGWNIYFYVGNTSNRAASRGIDEWLPPSLDQGIGLAFFVSLAVLLPLAFLAWRRRINLNAADWCLFACFLPLACGSIRMTAWWLIVLAPVVSLLLATLWPRPEIAQPSWGAALSFAVLLLAAVFSLPGLKHFNPLLAFKTQPAIEKHLDLVHAQLVRQRQTGRVFAPLEWGEYLTWAYTPAFPVFMDGRIEIYPDEVWQNYRTVTQGMAGWQEILDAYRVEILVLDPTFHHRTGLLPQVETSSAWQRLPTEGIAQLYLRTSYSTP